ncbi:hypothetical protein CPLU01_15038 [Colletotrichum plurivorum]|uniref:Uncharacterized protein n=1 Tax=Colletotrichum plurivorum TaxID=2175906 RepID=A0A8H6JFR2_9PEZI|nr:hypothetical protein CPLU01_15038 [Colletotrichum plurivorum]
MTMTKRPMALKGCARKTSVPGKTEDGRRHSGSRYVSVGGTAGLAGPARALGLCCFINNIPLPCSSLVIIPWRASITYPGTTLHYLEEWVPFSRPTVPAFVVPRLLRQSCPNTPGAGRLFPFLSRPARDDDEGPPPPRLAPLAPQPAGVESPIFHFVAPPARTALVFLQGLLHPGQVPTHVARDGPRRTLDKLVLAAGKC